MRRQVVTASAALVALVLGLPMSASNSEAHSTSPVVAAVAEESEGNKPLTTTMGLAFSEAGYSDVYDLYVGEDLATDRTGVLFFFDGDTASDETANYGDDETMARLRDVAAEHNLVLVAPHTPEGIEDEDFLNWWNVPAKGEYARELVKHVLASYDVDETRIWLTGFSGGAELVMSELMAHDRGWFAGGGAIVMGGGEAMRGVEAVDDVRIATMPLYWFIGSDDGTLEPNEDTWSAKQAADSGRTSYQEAGFTATQWIEIPDQGHSYDIPEVISTGLSDVRERRTEFVNSADQRESLFSPTEPGLLTSESTPAARWQWLLVATTP